MFRKIAQSFLIYLVLTMILGVFDYVSLQGKTISDNSSLLRAFFNPSVIWIVAIVWIADVIRIYRERNSKEV